MDVIVLDESEQRRLIQERREIGHDGHDEVWDRMYIMFPIPDLEHQTLVSGLCASIRFALGWTTTAMILPGSNVSDRDEGWEENYRVPDLTVTMPGSQARNCKTHWAGGPDFVVEVVTENDRTREKRDFYAKVGVRELMIVDRDPWSLELYRLADGVLTSVSTTRPGQPHWLASEVLPVSFRFIEEPSRPILEVRHADGVQAWSI